MLACGDVRSGLSGCAAYMPSSQQSCDVFGALCAAFGSMTELGMDVATCQWQGVAAMHVL